MNYALNRLFLRFARIAKYTFRKPYKPKKKPLPMKPSFRKSTSGFSSLTTVRRKIRKSAGNRNLLTITYRKTTDNTIHRYIVEPYSFRYRRIKIGLRKMLYGYDIADKHIKSFSISNILSASVMKDRFKPRFDIEIYQTVGDLYGE